MGGIGGGTEVMQGWEGGDLGAGGAGGFGGAVVGLVEEWQ